VKVKVDREGAEVTAVCCEIFNEDENTSEYSIWGQTQHNTATAIMIIRC